MEEEEEEEEECRVAEMRVHRLNLGLSGIEEGKEEEEREREER